jgi:hypothetical protein
MVYFKVLKFKNRRKTNKQKTYPSRTLYLAKLSSENEGEMKTFPVKPKAMSNIPTNSL